MKLEGKAIGTAFFNRDARVVAPDLLGKVLAHRVDGRWLATLLIETEAYLLEEKASHASLGYTEKRKALFMPPGTIYMYYARGKDSFNVSCRGAGNAVLFKAGIPHLDVPDAEEMVRCMATFNPLPSGATRDPRRLCSGQTLLCRALGLKVPDWDGLSFGGSLCLLDVGIRPEGIIRTTRLGIPPGRDGHLPYRFIDRKLAPFCTKNPFAPRKGTSPGWDEVVPPP